MRPLNATVYRVHHGPKGFFIRWSDIDKDHEYTSRGHCVHYFKDAASAGVFICDLFTFDDIAVKYPLKDEEENADKETCL